MLEAGRAGRVETLRAMGAAVDSTDRSTDLSTDGATRRRSVHFPVDERPAVLVRHTDGAWHVGRLHAWLRYRPRPGRSGGWRAVVSYHVAAGLQYYLDVPAERVRPAPAPVDRGRSADAEPALDRVDGEVQDE